MPDAALPYHGKLYRALNPIYAREPLSGEGARRHGGRFNPKGTPALYASLSVMTAIREANQVGSLQPTTLVCYEAAFDAIFDIREPANLAAYGMTEDDLALSTWRDEMRRLGASKTQILARALIDEGYQGMLARSFAAGSVAEDINLVLWTWGTAPPCQLTLIDEEGRLSR
jgi:RES domain-containing protein